MRPIRNPIDLNDMKQARRTGRCAATFVILSHKAEKESPAAHKWLEDNSQLIIDEMVGLIERELSRVSVPVKVSEQMVAAGVHVLLQSGLVERQTRADGLLVRDIFLAMAACESA